MDLATLIDCSYVEHLSPAILSLRVLPIKVTNRNRNWKQKKGLASPHCYHTFNVYIYIYTYIHTLNLWHIYIYDSVKREVFYNILIKFRVPMKVVRLIKM